MSGRSKFTEIQKRMILVEAVAIGDRAAADKHGLNRGTLVRWRKRIDKSEIERLLNESVKESVINNLSDSPFSEEFLQTIRLSSQFLNIMLTKAISNVTNLRDSGDSKLIAVYSTLFKTCLDLTILTELERDPIDG